MRQGLRTAQLFAPDRKTICNREWREDIVSRALAAAGAEKVHQEEWDMMGKLGNPYSPMDGLDFLVYRLQLRHARDHPNSNGPRGVRLGPMSRGSLTRELRAPKKMPPGARNASPREDIRFLGNLLLVGYPATMNTSAWPPNRGTLRMVIVKLGSQPLSSFRRP